MKKLLSMLAAGLILVACENRDGSTARAPENDNDRSGVRTEKDRDEERSSPVTGDIRDNDRGTGNNDRNDNEGLLDNRSEERIDRNVAMAGRSIFMSECASCHRVTDDDKVGNNEDNKKDGPELTNIVNRRNDRWLVKFMTNMDGEDRSNDDPEDVCMVQRKGKELNRDQALKVLEYLHMRNMAE